MKKTLTVLLILVSALSYGKGILIEAERFTDKGGWSIDQQFIDLMGSSYLIAHGLGNPVQDATSEFKVPRNGSYRIYVRTYNWTSPWTREAGPGAFKVKIDGNELNSILGTEGDKWIWQFSGEIRLKKGVHSISLSDLTGFDGRCDAIWITSEEGSVPPDDTKELEAFRRENGSISQKPVEGGEYDLIVVGAGIGGMCTAVSAARLGMKVALVSDREKLGGNNSSEIRVHLGGKIEMDPYPALGRMIREFGHSKGGNAKPAEYYEDDKKEAFIAAEPNITLFRLYRAVDVRMKDSRTIGSVIIRHVVEGNEVCISAPLFSDCTGDANLGFMAGADFRMGREGRGEFGENLAPEKGDKLTMGSSVQWYSAQTDSPASFPEFSYGIEFNEQNCQKVRKGEWTWETGMNRDQIYDFERIRDYGMLVIYSNWSFLKNHYSKKEDYACSKLDWVAYTAGKRESRRLMGDYILKQGDVDKQVFHEDASFTVNWHFDLHFPDKKNSAFFPGNEFKAATKHNPIYPYPVPYRCLYSRNINNMFMAGRNISVTHVTLGSTRLMRNIGMMGEVVGMAASICKKHGILPREVYQCHLDELKMLMSEGVGKKDAPDNQHFNLGGHLDKPRDIIF